MQGNSGGGGGFALGYMAAQNPEATAAVAVLAAISIAICSGVIYISDQMDRPVREPIVSAMVEDSLSNCVNSAAQGEVYTVDLKDGLMAVWSKDLNAFREENSNLVICEDDALNDFVLPYEYNEVGTTYTGEYRVMGVLYTNDSGAQALVIKPKTDTPPHNTIDDKPDRPVALDKILSEISAIPEDVYQHALPDGTKVSVYLQHDGVTQKDGSSTINDNDGKGWAEQKHIDQILTHYSFSWPAQSQSFALHPVLPPSGPS